MWGGCGSIEKTLQQGWVFADVNQEGLGCPASGGLDDGGGNAVLSESGSASCSH